VKLLPAMVAALGVFTACAARPAVDPLALEPLPEVQVVVGNEPGQKELGELPEYPVPDTASTIGYEIDARVLVGTREAVAEYFGPTSESLAAWEGTEAAANKTIISWQRRKLEVRTVPRVHVSPGQRGMLAITRRVSYASGLTLNSGQSGAVEHATPIEEGFEGFVLDVAADAAGEGRVRLSLDLILLGATQRAPEKEFKFAGAAVRDQTPVTFGKRLRAEGTVSLDRILVVTGMSEDGRAYVFLMKASRKPVASK
jgi:hypothetical protein